MYGSVKGSQFLAYFPKVRLCDLHPVCVSVCPPINFWMPESVFIKFIIYIYIYYGNWVHLNGVLHKSLRSVCVSVCISLLSLHRIRLGKVYHSFVTSQRLGKHVPPATNARKNRKIVGYVCLWVCLYISLSLLGEDVPATEELLEASFSMRSVSSHRKVGD
jgi:hypothetical protein